MQRDTLTTQPLMATLALLLAAFKLEQRDDSAACRAADRLLDHLGQADVRYARDGERLRVQSFSAATASLHSCTAQRCTCRAGHLPWCQHRVLRAVLQAQAALVPAALQGERPRPLPADQDGPPERIPCAAPPPPRWPPTSDPEARARAFAEIDELFAS